MIIIIILYSLFSMIPSCSNEYTWIHGHVSFYIHFGSTSNIYSYVILSRYLLYVSYKTRNQPKPPTTTQSQPKPLTTSLNHPTTIHNQPKPAKITQPNANGLRFHTSGRKISFFLSGFTAPRKLSL